MKHREPALQNLPTRSELGREIRRAFIAPVTLNIDFAALEQRIAELSRRGERQSVPPLP